MKLNKLVLYVFALATASAAFIALTYAPVSALSPVQQRTSPVQQSTTIQPSLRLFEHQTMTEAEIRLRNSNAALQALLQKMTADSSKAASARVSTEAVTKPGTGYDPRKRSLTNSRYILYNIYTLTGISNRQSVSCTPCSASCECPDPLGCTVSYRQGPIVSRPIAFDWLDILSPVGINRRYGTPQPNLKPCADPGAARRLKWEGFDNEQEFMYAEALKMICEREPALIFSAGLSGGYSCVPTLIEVRDAAAVYDRGLLLWWAQRIAGGSPENPLEQFAPGQPCTWTDKQLLFPELKLYLKNTAPCGGQGGNQGGSQGGGQGTPGTGSGQTPTGPVQPDTGQPGGTPQPSEPLPVCPFDLEGIEPQGAVTLALVGYRPGLQSTGRLTLEISDYRCREK